MQPEAKAEAEPEAEPEVDEVEAVSAEAPTLSEKVEEPAEVVPDEEVAEAVAEPAPEPVEKLEPEAGPEEAAPEEAAAKAEAAEAEAVAEEEAPSAETTESELDEMRAHIKRKRSDHDVRLKLARTLWQTGEIQEAMQHYARLIKSSAKTDEMMADLEQYTEEKPNEPSVLRTLGDAYMKFGELDRALEIYNHAMDLL